MYTGKRTFDIMFSLAGIIFLSPFFLLFMLLIFIQDKHSPFYIPYRIGKDGKMFPMVKLRSMVVDADKAGIDTAAVNDKRITKLGMVIRKFKLDELFQLWNVLIGDMSLVGPRPNVKVEADLYTNQEKRLLSIRPGISDISSIVFSDLGDIVANAKDANIAYNQLVRPWKSRLGLLYIDNMSLILDVKIIFLTFIAIFSRGIALKGVQGLLKNLDAPEDIIEVSKRNEALVPTPPPGSQKIVTER